MFLFRKLSLRARGTERTLKSNLNNVKHPKIPRAPSSYVRFVDDNVFRHHTFIILTSCFPLRVQCKDHDISPGHDRRYRIDK